MCADPLHTRDRRRLTLLNAIPPRRLLKRHLAERNDLASAFASAADFTGRRPDRPLAERALGPLMDKDA